MIYIVDAAIVVVEMIKMIRCEIEVVGKLGVSVSAAKVIEN